MADGQQLHITTEHGSGFVVLSPRGEIGSVEAPTLRVAVKDAYAKGPGKLVVDLSGVSYMSTAGVATLVEALQLSRRNHVPLILCAMTDRVRAVFEIARLHTVFKIVPTRDDATK